jgi:hypothetical protein
MKMARDGSNNMFLKAANRAGREKNGEIAERERNVGKGRQEKLERENAGTTYCPGPRLHF